MSGRWQWTRNQGSDKSCRAPGWWGGQSPTSHTHWRPLRCREIKCSAVAFSPGTSCKFLSIPFFLIESGSEMFRQEIIYVSIFQRHFIVWRRERGTRKSQYKNKSNSRWIFFEIKKCLLLFISLLSFQLYDVIKVPFPTQYFQMIKTLGTLLMFGCNEIYFGIWKNPYNTQAFWVCHLSSGSYSAPFLPSIALEST